MEDDFVVARAPDRYAPAAHTLTEALLPTTCVVVNKPPALKHFPTIGLTPDRQKVVHAYREIAAVTSRSAALGALREGTDAGLSFERVWRLVLSAPLGVQDKAAGPQKPEWVQSTANAVMRAQLGLLPASLHALLALLTDGRPASLGRFFRGGLPDCLT